MKKVVLVCSVLAYAIACNVAFADELPKDNMVVAASSSVSGYVDSVPAAIDGDPNVGWRTNSQICGADGCSLRGSTAAGVTRSD